MQAQGKKNQILSIGEIWGEWYMTRDTLSVNFACRVSSYKLKVPVSGCQSQGLRGNIQYIVLNRTDTKEKEGKSKKT